MPRRARAIRSRSAPWGVSLSCPPRHLHGCHTVIRWYRRACGARSCRTFACIIGRVIELSIPGCGEIRLEHLVTDVNGTLAVDGMLLEGLAKRIAAVRDRLTVHLLTADTHGRQAFIDEQLGLAGTRLAPGNEQDQKRSFVAKLGADSVVAIGQGANDALMLREAAIGICVLSKEGLAVETLLAADLVTPDVYTAFDLLEKPVRLVASLRK
jgi:soluble P-type ATPase